MSRMPSSATPSASGWNPGAQNASKQCTKASKPVAAVILGGRPTVSSGSAMTMPGIIFGWKMIFFWCVSSLRMTPARPTSLPVPAVVGTATMGAMPFGIGARPPVADVLEIPQRARLARHERDDLAGIQARAAAEGDDAIVRAGAIGLEARFDVGRHGIAAHVGK